MFKTETHIHTRESSPCGWLRAEEIVKAYYEAGYRTICISDHFGNFDSLGNISWQDKITIFLEGYFKAKCAAEKYDINVLMSAEIEFQKNKPNHYLVYGITRDFLNSYPDLSEMGIEEFSKIAKEKGIFIVQAHPFRNGKCYPTPDFVDAIEIYNANPRHQDFSEKSKKVAEENNMCISGGSDMHRPEDIARSGIITEMEIKTSEDLIATIKNRRLKIIGL